jgi:hypothetical protein
MNKGYLIMDLIFRSISRAAGVEIPPDHYLPWETLQHETPKRPGLLRRSGATAVTIARRTFGRALGALGNRLIQVGDVLTSF